MTAPSRHARLPASPRSRKARSLSPRQALAGTSRIAILWISALFFGLPVLWLLFAATKTPTQLLFGNPLSFGSIQNIATGWGHLLRFNNGELLWWLYNSIYYTIGGTGISLLLSIPAGYGLAKFTFIGRKTLLVLTLIGMIVPEAALVLPLYLEMNALGLLGTPFSVIFPLGFYPFAVYLAYAYYSATIPTSLLEAARVDGASEARIFATIVLPLSKPVLGMVFFFSFVRVWTNFFLMFVMLGDDRTLNLQVGLMSLLESTGAITPGSGFSDLDIHQPEAALAALVTVGPILVMFLVAQRYLSQSGVVGAEKG